ILAGLEDQLVRREVEILSIGRTPVAVDRGDRVEVEVCELPGRGQDRGPRVARRLAHAVEVAAIGADVERPLAREVLRELMLGSEVGADAISELVLAETAPAVEAGVLLDDVGLHVERIAEAVRLPAERGTSRQGEGTEPAGAARPAQRRLLIEPAGV